MSKPRLGRVPGIPRPKFAVSHEQEQRLYQMARLRVKGCTYEEIARIVGNITLTTVRLKLIKGPGLQICRELALDASRAADYDERVKLGLIPKPEKPRKTERWSPGLTPAPADPQKYVPRPSDDV